MEDIVTKMVKFGSFVTSSTIMIILSSIKLSLIDYTVLWMTLVRCLATWMIFKNYYEGTPGFEATDIKL